MQLSVGRRTIVLPARYCDPRDVQAAVSRWNPPFVVVTASGERMFSTRRPVFLDSSDGVRVECADDAEVAFACKLVAAEHNHACEFADDTRVVIEDTARVQAEVDEFMAAPDDEPENSVGEEEDMTIEEWNQLGYNWFTKQDLAYF